MVPLLIGVHMFNSMFSSNYFVWDSFCLLFWDCFFWEYFAIRDCFCPGLFCLGLFCLFTRFSLGSKRVCESHIKSNEQQLKYKKLYLFLTVINLQINSEFLYYEICNIEIIIRNNDILKLI